MAESSYRKKKTFLLSLLTKQSKTNKNRIAYRILYIFSCIPSKFPFNIILWLLRILHGNIPLLSLRESIRKIFRYTRTHTNWHSNSQKTPVATRSNTRIPILGSVLLQFTRKLDRSRPQNILTERSLSFARSPTLLGVIQNYSSIRFCYLVARFICRIGIERTNTLSSSFFLLPCATLPTFCDEIRAGQVNNHVVVCF